MRPEEGEYWSQVDMAATGSGIPWFNGEMVSWLKGPQPKWNGSSKWRIVKRWTYSCLKLEMKTFPKII